MQTPDRRGRLSFIESSFSTRREWEAANALPEDEIALRQQQRQPLQRRQQPLWQEQRHRLAFELDEVDDVMRLTAQGAAALAVRQDCLKLAAESTMDCHHGVQTSQVDGGRSDGALIISRHGRYSLRRDYGVRPGAVITATVSDADDPEEAAQEVQELGEHQ